MPGGNSGRCDPVYRSDSECGMISACPMARQSFILRMNLMHVPLMAAKPPRHSQQGLSSKRRDIRRLLGIHRPQCSAASWHLFVFHVQVPTCLLPPSFSRLQGLERVSLVLTLRTTTLFKLSRIHAKVDAANSSLHHDTLPAPQRLPETRCTVYLKLATSQCSTYAALYTSHYVF